jgi:hypothetical protein
VYVPSLNFENTHVVMTIQELQDMAQQDPTLSAMTTAILSPILRAIAVMKTTCADYSNWKVGDNYVSFDLRVDGAEILVTNACIHTIAETLLGTCPDYRCTIPKNNRTTAQDIQSIIDNIAEGGIDANVELGRFERLMMEGKPAVLRPEIGVPVLDLILDDNLILRAKTIYGQFVNTIGNNLNNNSESLNIKAEAVNGLHTFIRENLVKAENRDSFCFLNAELIPGESTKRLSNHKIWWKVDGAFQKIDWTKLLIPHLGAIHKKHRTMKSVLNELDANDLYPLNRM